MAKSVGNLTTGAEMSRSNRYDNLPRIPTLAVALYMAGRDYRGGIKALALEMGVDYNQLQKRLNPDQHAHKLTPEELVQVITVTQDSRILASVGQSTGTIFAQPVDVSTKRSATVAAGKLMSLSAEFVSLSALFLDEATKPSEADVHALEYAGHKVCEMLVGMIAGAKMAQKLADAA